MQVQNPPQILIVDDEDNIRKSLRRSLRNNALAVTTIGCPLDALRQMRKTDYNLVIADLKMPEMNGSEFLNMVAEIFPKTSRILISGHANQRDLESFINQCPIEHFFTKPWDPGDFSSKVEQVVVENIRRRKSESLRLTNDHVTGDLQELQRVLQPAAIHGDSLHCVHTFISGDSLGGDCLGYHLTDHKFCFYQFDVAGSGISSAIESLAIRAMLTGADFTDPSQLLVDINKNYPFLNEPMRYVTVLCGCLDIDSGRLLISSAGYTTPTLVGDNLTHIEGRGIPVGIASDSTYFNIELTMERGNKLLVWSDGMADEDDDELIQLIGEYSDASVVQLKPALDEWL